MAIPTPDFQTLMQEHISENILTEKELVVSECLTTIADELIKTISHLRADEASAAVSRQVDQTFSSYPVVFQQRWGSFLKEFVLKQYALSRYKELTIIDTKTSSLACLSLKYQKVFDAWVDDDKAVSFTAIDKHLLGELSPKDSFILHLFAMATCRRVKNDQCFALSVTGKSTTGKSTLFESPLLDFGHNYNADSGCGRFQIEPKNLLIAHDVNIKVLITGKDADKFRAISRGELCKAKIHSSEVTIPPTFLFVTSNQNIQNHTFSKHLQSSTSITDLKSTINLMGLKTFSSQLTKPGQKRNQNEFVVAIQKRFLEAFVRKAPSIPLDALPTDGDYFQRMHLVLGIFARVINILVMPDLTLNNCGSKTLLRYCYFGLVNNYDLYKNHMNRDDDETILNQMTLIKNKMCC